MTRRVDKTGPGFRQRRCDIGSHGFFEFQRTVMTCRVIQKNADPVVELELFFFRKANEPVGQVLSKTNEIGDVCENKVTLVFVPRDL